MRVAIMKVCRALIGIFAPSTIALIARFTGARIPTNGVATLSLLVTLMGPDQAFIDVDTALSPLEIAVGTDAEEPLR